MNTGSAPVHKRQRLSDEYTACDSELRNKDRNTKISGWINMFKTVFTEDLACVWAEKTLRLCLTRYQHIRPRGKPNDRKDVIRFAKQVKKLVVADILQGSQSADATKAAQKIHKYRNGALASLLEEFIVGTSASASLPPIIHIPNVKAGRYDSFEMLNVNQADTRRFYAGRVTVKELSLKNYWTPCFVDVKTKQIISLPGGAKPLSFVDVETEYDGVVTVHRMVDERLIQKTRRDENFTATSRACLKPTNRFVLFTISRHM